MKDTDMRSLEEVQFCGRAIPEGSPGEVTPES